MNFDYSFISDLYKDVNGFRPRSQSFWSDWNDTDDSGRDLIVDGLVVQLKQNEVEQKAADSVAISGFESLIDDTISLGAGNRETAIRWLVSEENIQGKFDAESFVYDQGFLFTDYGKNLVDEVLIINNLNN